MEYKSEIKNCQNCKKDFTIEPDDFFYYQKIGVLPPKICSDCRAQLRLCFRNTNCFYKSLCANCKKDTFSVFSSNKDNLNWCLDCWWSDDLDGKKYAIDFDLNKSFFDQFNELWNKIDYKIPNLVIIWLYLKYTI